MSAPFAYPAVPHARNHGPQGYTDYTSYRPWLRDEFSFRCVYCLFREQWGRVRGVYTLDHFLPVALHPGKATDYDNLLYVCASCNSAKGVREVPDPLIYFINPLVSVDEDGRIHTDNPEAAQLIEVLGLNSPQSTEFRALWIGIVALAVRHEPDLYRRLMGYPADLPNLSRLQPPGGNSRPKGVDLSAFARRERGELPRCY